MVDHLTELREQASLALCAKRYNDVILIYHNYLKIYDEILPKDRQMLYTAYNKLILDYNFKSYWKLISVELSKKTDFNYLETIENEIDYLCYDVIKLIDNYFLASKLNKDLDIIMTLRQRADFLFFNSSISRPATKQIMLQSALRSYTEGKLERVLFSVSNCCDKEKQIVKFRCRTISFNFTSR